MTPSPAMTQSQPPERPNPPSPKVTTEINKLIKLKGKHHWYPSGT